MENKILPKTKKIQGVILIIVAFISIYNTNNNPTILIERILKPIKIGGGTLFYAGLVPILLIYYGLKSINKNGDYRLLKTRIRRIIITLIILNIGLHLSTNTVKFIKGMSKDLNAIYCYRDNDFNSLSVGQDQDNNLIVTSSIELENCSNESQEFNIAIVIPENFKKFIHENIQLKDNEFQTSKKFVLHGKERKTITAEFFVEEMDEDLSFVSSTWPFEFTLFNDNQKVQFINKVNQF
ncbi:hypothetical protein SH2C18_14950 [Clostridium sediminicola]|uniref:hypothetical protein n=1 Tax=Clostridium sediminicola TaxID=3114879 RepID=UPI0031F25287